MTHNHFTYKELFSFGWGKTKLHYWFLLKVALICAVISGATMFIPLANGLVSLALSIAVISVALSITQGQAPQFGDMLKPFDTYKVFWHSFLATLLYALIVIVGIILFILPGIYLATRLKFYMYLIMENENMKPLDSLKKSMDLTKNKFWKLFFFAILTGLFNFAGFLVLGIGLLVTIPITLIAHTLLYKKLCGTNAGHHEPVHHAPREGAHLATS